MHDISRDREKSSATQTTERVEGGFGFKELREWVVTIAALAGLTLGVFNTVKDQEDVQLATLLEVDKKLDEATARMGSNVTRTMEASATLSDIDLEAVYALLRDAERLLPGYARTFFLRGQWCLLAQQYKSALANAEEFILREPSRADGHNLRAVAQHFLGNAKEALGSYEEALARIPLDDRRTRAAALANLSGAARDFGMLERAIDYAEQAIEEAPHLAEPYTALGSSLKDAGQYGAAEQPLRQSLDIAPSEDAYALLVNCLGDLAKVSESDDGRNFHAEAREAAEAGLEQFPESAALQRSIAVATFNEAIALSSSGEDAAATDAWELALGHINAALELMPGREGLHRMKGWALRYLGRNDDADRVFEIAEKIKGG
ncbi:tetratricopeptide repeat protein [Engelhardtia mirabilis]|uniref:Tetratricopeptide repeat protein n=1 Tax=Engelhardtia mirabilis TaxID=2528011 RepID=A0A518BT57_9BACT|nr:Tetratricopeptide repeat protein [Planctomycetes bacterium Pla133]QDV04484.1 Tetratricopeptide repeat protein [Planctomycetes bacterium Pla86]